MMKVDSEKIWVDLVKTKTGFIAVSGYLVIAAFFAGFGFWAAYASLQGAVIASGYVVAGGANQNIQHLEGGIIKSVEVQEGSRVKANDALFVMDDTATRARHNRYLKALISAELQINRLVNERDGNNSFEYSEKLKEDADEFDLNDLLDEQYKEFYSRYSSHQSELAILKQRGEALNDNIKGIEAQKFAAETQLALIREEALLKKALLAKGLTHRSEYTRLLRTEAELVGHIASATSQLASTNTQIIEARERELHSTSKRSEGILSSLNQLRTQKNDLDEQILASQDILKRLVVRAPSDGIIVKIYKNTAGSVVRAGEDLIVLLPTTLDLIVEARLQPTDVDVVSLNQKAMLHFVALNSRVTPKVEAIVSYISADRIIDKVTQQPYYTARLVISETLPENVSKDQIYPGMPVETFISTKSRTFFEYVVQPLTDSFNRAFRES